MRELIDVEKVFFISLSQRERCSPVEKKRAPEEQSPRDANEEVIQKAVDIYEMESKPVLTHYPQRLHHRDYAMQPPAKVLFDILASVNGVKHESAAIENFNRFDPLLRKVPGDDARREKLR